MGMRVPSMTDFFGFTMAAMNERGSVFANPQNGDKTPSTIMYRPFNSWTSNSEVRLSYSINEVFVHSACSLPQHATTKMSSFFGSPWELASLHFQVLCQAA